MTESRRETYEQLVSMGNTPQEAWERIAQMDFAEDYDEPEEYFHEEDYDYDDESQAYRPGIDFRTSPRREMILRAAEELGCIDRDRWSVPDIRAGEFTLCRGQGKETYRIAYDEGRNLYSIYDSSGSEVTEELEGGFHDVASIARSVLVHAVKLEMGRAMETINGLKEEAPLFLPHEKELIMHYAYKMDSSSKAEELAEALVYCRDCEPANAPLIAIDAKAEIDAFPDRMIGFWEMHAYGYPGEEMLPLTKERAQELSGCGIAVHLLFRDGSEKTAAGGEQLISHDGIFGVAKDDWEEEKRRISVQEEAMERSGSKEQRLLSGSTGRYGIYQLKEAPGLDRLRFEGTASLMKKGMTDESLGIIRPENYGLVYVGELLELEGETQQEKLNEIYVTFNIFRPGDFMGHSLSVSDIVVLHENGENRAYYVDSYGFTELPGYAQGILKQLSEEMDRKRGALDSTGTEMAGSTDEGGWAHD